MTWEDGNAIYSITDGVLAITFNISEVAIATAPESASGKTKVVATTHGFMVLPGPHGLKLALNLTAPNPRGK
jgi:hypothetical protein